jgi:hypothetical protein
MIVYLNDKKISLHTGMKVKHALTSDQLRDVRAGREEVRDHSGFPVGLEGSLTEGTRLYISRRGADSNDAAPPPRSSR